MLFNWTTNTMYDPPGLNISQPVYTTPGWRIYVVDLATQGLLVGSEPWNGIKRSLRLDPTQDNAAAGGQVDIDWIRLVDNQPALWRNITWNGSGAVNIHLDNDNNAANGTLGVVAPGVIGQQLLALRWCAATGKLLRRNSAGRRRRLRLFDRLLPGQRSGDADSHLSVRGRKHGRLRDDAAQRSVGHDERDGHRSHDQLVAGVNHHDSRRRNRSRHGAREHHRPLRHQHAR